MKNIIIRIGTIALAIAIIFSVFTIFPVAAENTIRASAPGSGYVDGTIYVNGKAYTVKFYLQYDASFRARSKCYCVASVTVSHQALTVKFDTYRNGYQTVQSGAKYYTVAQKNALSDPNNTYSNYVTYSAANDHAEGILNMSGSVIVNGSETFSTTWIGGY